jgi:hypothetical protein
VIPLLLLMDVFNSREKTKSRKHKLQSSSLFVFSSAQLNQAAIEQGDVLCSRDESTRPWGHIRFR